MMIFLIYITMLLSLQGDNPVGQSTNAWHQLAMVTIEKSYNEMMGVEITTATPLPIAQALHGEEITLRGYMISLEAVKEQSHFLFSRYPQNMCFFCGAAGPESAMQVFLGNGKKLSHTKDMVVLKGTLNIQKGDPSGLIYTLHNAELIEILK